MFTQVYKSIRAVEQLPYMSIKEFARLVSVHPMTVRRCIKRGKLQFLNLGTAKRPLYRIPSSEINRIAEFDLEELIFKFRNNTQ